VPPRRPSGRALPLRQGNTPGDTAVDVPGERVAWTGRGRAGVVATIALSWFRRIPERARWQVIEPSAASSGQKKTSAEFGRFEPTVVMSRNVQLDQSGAPAVRRSIPP
jgi:hypothetical protein